MFFYTVSDNTGNSTKTVKREKMHSYFFMFKHVKSRIWPFCLFHACKLNAKYILKILCVSSKGVQLDNSIPSYFACVPHCTQPI